MSDIDLDLEMDIELSRRLRLARESAIRYFDLDSADPTVAVARYLKSPEGEIPSWKYAELNLQLSDPVPSILIEHWLQKQILFETTRIRYMVLLDFADAPDRPGRKEFDRITLYIFSIDQQVEIKAIKDRAAGHFSRIDVDDPPETEQLN